MTCLQTHPTRTRHAAQDVAGSALRFIRELLDRLRGSHPPVGHIDEATPDHLLRDLGLLDGRDPRGSALEDRHRFR